MGREARRVPLDFDWPMKEVWEGYLTPERLQEDPCPNPDCNNGWGRDAGRLYGQWYGNAPFDPRETRSSRLTPRSRAVWRFARRNVERSPEFYGPATDENIHREAARLVEMWNKQWSHHLEQADVDALAEAGRLRDLTHDFNPDAGPGEERWTPKPDVVLTPRLVNDWDILSMGHDGINAHVCVRAKAKRLGYEEVCSTCKGHGCVEKYEGQRAEAEAWAEEDHDPPTGEGWQMWETTTEGSPMSPVFATAEELARWLEQTRASIFGGASASYAEWMRLITGEEIGYRPPQMPGAIFI